MSLTHAPIWRSILIKFNAAPNKVITVMIYGEFENLLEIDKFGGVLYNIYERNLKKKMESVALSNEQLDYLA